MNNAIPSTWNDSLLIYKSNRKNSIVMPDIIPSCWLKIDLYSFCIYKNKENTLIVNSHMKIFASCSKAFGWWWKINSVNSIMLLVNIEQGFERRHMMKSYVSSTI
jgi:hypothetical protein